MTIVLAYLLSAPVERMPNNLLSDTDVAISNIAGYYALYYDKIQRNPARYHNILMLDRSRWLP